MADEKNMVDEELDDVLILIDEDEQEHPFQMIDMVEVDGSQYAVLVPLEEGSDEEEAIILKIVEMKTAKKFCTISKTMKNGKKLSISGMSLRKAKLALG